MDPLLEQGVVVQEKKYDFPYECSKILTLDLMKREFVVLIDLFVQELLTHFWLI